MRMHFELTVGRRGSLEGGGKRWKVPDSRWQHVKQNWSLALALLPFDDDDDRGHKVALELR